MKDRIIWGLVIQGPLIGFGYGPNNSKSGFNAEETIRKNINAFKFCVKNIVISTWKGSGYSLSKKEKNDGIILLENDIPYERRPDNRLKQFVSTLAGIKYLEEKTSATHILKIRTDQVIDPSIVEWLNDFFSQSSSFFESGSSSQTNFLVFSEYRSDSLYYLGDFIIAGTKKDMKDFCVSNEIYGSKNLHPSGGTDYVLKYLAATDKSFYEYFYKYWPLLLQVSKSENESVNNYWHELLSNRFSIMPRKFYTSLHWRGILMTEILSSEVIDGFSFYEEWLSDSKKITQSSKVRSISQLVPNKTVLKIAKQEYYRYYRSLIKFYLKKIKFMKKYLN